MNTEHNKPPQRKIWNLLSGILFLGVGSYRVYNHFYTDANYNTFTLVLAVAIIGFGLFRLYGYFSSNN